MTDTEKLEILFQAIITIAQYQHPEERISEYEDVLGDDEDFDEYDAFDGLGREEWLEMAYENCIMTARGALEYIKRMERK